MGLLIHGVFSRVMLKKNSMFQRFIINLLDSCSKKGFFLRILYNNIYGFVLYRYSVKCAP